MTIERVPDTNLEYFLVSYDKNGIERTDDPDAESGRLSDSVKKALADEPVTDCFLISHGWKGDIPAAKAQYNAWIGAMAECHADRAHIQELRPEFNPLIVGLHWPSLPWGDEELSDSPVSFSLDSDAEPTLEEMVDDAADKLVDTDRARQALRTIFNSALEDMAPSALPDNVVEAYGQLFSELGFEGAGPGGSPGSDFESFNPETVYQQCLDESAISYGGGMIGNGILTVMRQLSFWTMKARAKTFGEGGAATLLRELQQLGKDKETKFHLMGHSFGCIVVSAAVAGRDGAQPLVNPVDSLFLVQGALSLWAYCSDIPHASKTPGYFHGIAKDRKVSGPMVSTQSELDTAVKTLYPLGAQLKRQVAYAPGEDLNGERFKAAA